MRAPAARLLLALCLAGVANSAGAQDYAYALSAGDVRGLIDQGKRAVALAYISGVMDTLMRSRDFCVPEGDGLGRIGGLALTLMGQQPRDSNAPAADVLGVWLHADYPCGTN